MKLKKGSSIDIDAEIDVSIYSDNGNNYLNIYLTVDDIFQPSIIETVYPISGNSFFTANFKNTDKGYLLPLKQTLFEYMSLEDLKGVTNEPSPRPIFEISSKNFKGLNCA